MQAVTPVDIHVDKDWHRGSELKGNIRPFNRKDRQATRMRTRVLNKTKPKKSTPSSVQIPKQVVMPKLVPQSPPRTPSPNRGPWVPPPGRATKGHKLSWQSPKSRLEINPVMEISVNGEKSLDTDRNQQNTSLVSPTKTLSTNENEKIMETIQTYEKRIQALIDGISMLKEQMHQQADPERTDQLRSDIDSSLVELEQLQKSHAQLIANRPKRVSRSQSPSPIRQPYRSSSADEQRSRRSITPKVSFQDDPIIEKRRARSTTPIKGPILLNPDREQLLRSLADSEGDLSQIIKRISSVRDTLMKLKMDDQPVSLEVEQLYRQRSELLHSIEQFERSNSKLKEFLRHQYHLEAEDGITHERYETLTTQIHELKNENAQMRRLLLDRENDNITLLNELERIRTHAIGFDTMKSSLEQNRAHLQRELYAKEGEINRLQCALRSLERDLRRGRHRPLHHSPVNTITKTRTVTIERLQAELDDRDDEIARLKKALYGNKTDQTDGTNLELIHLRTQLERAEQSASEYKAQLHTQSLKSSASNSRNHLSEIELEKIRARLQKRIEELEPLPELLKQAESKNDKLQKQVNDMHKRASDSSGFFTQNSPDDRQKDTQRPSTDDEHRNLHRRITALEEQNEKLLKTVATKDEELRIARLHNKSPEPSYVPKPNDLIRRDDLLIIKPRLTQPSAFDLDQQISRLRLECNQLKREKDELERHFTSEIGELRDQLKHSNHNNRTMQSYLNSLKTSYTTLFSDAIPTSLMRNNIS